VVFNPVQDGRIQAYRDGTLSPLGCEEELGPVQEILAAPTGGEEQEPSLLCLLSSGRACKVSRCRVFTDIGIVPDPGHFGVDPDPAIFVIDLQDSNKKLISFFREKKSKRSHKTV
jgi:hypothetical protein